MTRLSLRRCAAVLCLALFAAMPPSLAGAAARWQPPPPQTVPDGFEPVSEVPPGEQIPAQPLVAAAYAFIWVAVLAYVWMLWRRQAAVQKDLDALRRGSPR